MVLIVTTVQADGVFKWIDEEGNVHFGDRPPATSSPRSVALPKAQQPDAATLERLAKQRKYLEARQEDRDQAAAGAAEEEKRKQERAAQCQQVEERLALLEKGGRLYTEEANGERHYLSDAERSVEIEIERKKIADFCP